MTAVIEEHSPFYFFVIIRNSDKPFFPKPLAGEMIEDMRISAKQGKKGLFPARSSGQHSLSASLFIIHLIYSDLQLILNQSSKPVKVTFPYMGKANLARLKHVLHPYPASFHLGYPCPPSLKTLGLVLSLLQPTDQKAWSRIFHIFLLPKDEKDGLSSV